MPERESSPWLMLIHQIPAKPDYLRVKVWRRLQRLGAIALKNSVWVLPKSDAAREDFEWLLKEIAADGGEGVLCEASFLAGITTARAADLDRLREAHSGGRRVATQMASSGEGEVAAGAYRGRLWVTRPDVHIDRIASAWLIQRRIDLEARFSFRAEAGYVPSAGELRFDMFEGEFTHEGDRCTFEVLARRFAPEDGALERIGEIVHDVDFKDDKFGAAEAPGFARIIEGICARNATDLRRLERGGALLDDLYAALSAAPRSGMG